MTETKKPIFEGKHYVKHDYGDLWKHIAISYECKHCDSQYVTEKECREHLEKKHGK